MKKIALFCIFIIALNFSFLHAQWTGGISDKTSFTQVVETSKSSKKIYKAIKIWVSENGASSITSTDIDDPNSGLISFNLTTVSFPYSYIVPDDDRIRVKYKVVIEIKDNKFRFRATNFIMINDYKDYHHVSSLYSLAWQIELASETINDLKNKLAKETNPKKQKRIKGKIKERLLYQTIFEVLKEKVEKQVVYIKNAIEDSSDF